MSAIKPKKSAKPSKGKAIASPIRKAKMYLHASSNQSPQLARKFDQNFTVTEEYRKSLPDMMLANDAILGSKVAIQQVGISNFKVPLTIAISSKLHTTVEASVVGTVSLGAHLKGINMSRILRSFYKFKDKKFNIDSLAQILKSYKKDLGSESARLKINFSFPLEVSSLRSKLEGFQYYKASFEAFIDSKGDIRRFTELDFVYSSACPCASELSEHARESRGIYSIPHSQRSKARVKIEHQDGASVSLQDLREKCLEALKTETQVVVKREDEQAFAELNGYYLKFVEDACRLVYEQLNSDKRIKDFEIICAHFESLHSHDAVSAICKGIPNGLRANFSDFNQLNS